MRRDRDSLHIASQNIIEFWVVATRPVSENGLGLTIDQALHEVVRLKRFFILLPELPLQSEWERLVVTFRVSGKNGHDARLVAAMSVHRLDRILTFNVADFTRYTGIKVLDPKAVF